MVACGTSRVHSERGNVDEGEQVPTAEFFPAIEDEDPLEKDPAWPLPRAAGALSAFSKPIRSGGQPLSEQSRLLAKSQHLNKSTCSFYLLYLFLFVSTLIERVPR